MKKAAAWLLDLLYPPKCPVCGKLLRDTEHGACNRCLLELPIRSEPLPSIPLVAACVTPFRYEGTLRESLLRYKFQGMQHYAKFYAPYLAASVQERLPAQIDLISWVPIHRRRRLERGFDQAQLLAQQTAKLLGIPCVRTLRKQRHNRRQSGIQGEAERRANVRGVYCPVHPERFRGRQLLLIDDIVTTGATLSECALVLQTAGAASVCAAAVAAAAK